MIKIDPMTAIKNADFVLDILSELRLNGVVRMSDGDKITEAVKFFEDMREVSYKELSLDY
jgi:hypothetical protein|tara:strand:- start:1111 stop:1290 length:180 start_codon:yes stop_codon:yes gene_type:complete